jgi:hypothetical protein
VSTDDPAADARLQQRVARFARAVSLAGVDPADFDALAVIEAADLHPTGANDEEGSL